MSNATPLDTQLRQDALDHMLAAVEATEIHDDPSPHIVVQDFFPADTYARILECLPSPADYEPFAYEKHATADGESNRKRFQLKNACLETLPQTQREFWHSIRSALGSVALKETIFHRLQKGLAYRFDCDPEKASSLPGFALPELFHETSGYRIKPHPDTRKKVITMQIALPENGDQEHLGTEFYRRSMRPSCWLREPKGFEIVKTMPFLPNTAYAFVVLNTMRIKSWYGRSSLSSSCGARNSLLNIWYQRAEQANTEIIEENQSFLSQQKAA
jgi:hypothetical protein